MALRPRNPPAWHMPREARAGVGTDTCARALTVAPGRQPTAGASRMSPTGRGGGGDWVTTWGLVTWNRNRKNPTMSEKLDTQGCASCDNAGVKRHRTEEAAARHCAWRRCHRTVCSQMVRFTFHEFYRGSKKGTTVQSAASRSRTSIKGEMLLSVDPAEVTFVLARSV